MVPPVMPMSRRPSSPWPGSSTCPCLISTSNGMRSLLRFTAPSVRGNLCPRESEHVIAVDERPVYALKSKPAVPASYEEALERARALAPRLRERVAETEQLRHLPAENVADLLENGLYGVMTPKRFGGSELGSETMIDVTMELAAACPSTGWVHMLWTAHMCCWRCSRPKPRRSCGAIPTRSPRRS